MGQKLTAKNNLENQNEETKSYPHNQDKLGNHRKIYL